MNPPRSPPRRAAALIVALVVLVVVGSLTAVWLSSAVVQQRLGRFEAQQLQALLLAESGLERAQARRQADAAYRGETWRPARFPDDEPLGVVELTAAPLGAEPTESWRLTAVAVLPAAGPPRARVELSRDLSLSK